MKPLFGLPIKSEPIYGEKNRFIEITIFENFFEFQYLNMGTSVPVLASNSY